ncbi:MAG: hypothetical protein GX589_00045 [Deltaproteobacteria bacterium]|nr:hypothetical protein [Deltaproteobacteria bacterium]
MTQTNKHPQGGDSGQEALKHNEGEGGRRDSVHLFVGVIGEYLSRQELQNHIRITPNGVFVEESGFSRVVESYQDWLKKHTGGEVTKSTEKCVKRLFESPQPQKFYLVEGKQCLLGYLIKCHIEQPQSYNLPFYLGSLLDTREYLHPRDPFLAAQKNVEVIHKPLGAEFKLPFKKKSLLVPTQALKDFADLARGSIKLLERNPEAASSMRESLRTLIRVLSRVQPIGEKETLLIPAKHRSKSALKYFRLGSLILVTAKGEVLLDCYELRGKNYARLLQEEVEALGRISRGRQIGALELPKKRSRYIGAVQLKHERIMLHFRALREFIDQIPASASLRESFSGRFTVYDCLNKISFIIAGTERAERRQVMAYLGKDAPRNARFRVKDEWIFVLLEKNVLMGCINKRYRPRRNLAKHPR